MSNDDLISRREATTIPILPIEHRKYQTMNLDDVYDLGWLDCQNCIEKLLPAQPELIEKTAYIRGFEQGRTQGMIDAQGGKNMIKAEWTNADALNLQPTCNQLATDCISRQTAIDAFDGTKVDETDCTEYDIGYNDGIDFAVSKLSVLLPAQPELIEKAAYVRGFEQGRIQGKIDAQQEIIKCEKCKHYTALTGICEVRGKGLRLIRRPDEFCSRGARREE